MARRYFHGKSQEWLEARLAEVYDEKASGKVLSSFGSSDTNAAHTVSGDLSIDRREKMLLWDLGILDPVTYPPADIVRVTRTRIKIYSSESINDSETHTLVNTDSTDELELREGDFLRLR